MKNKISSLKEIIGGLMMLTYEHLLATIAVIVTLISSIIFSVAKSMACYGQQINYLERTLDSGLTMYQIQMWLFDALTIFCSLVLFVYVSELFRYYTKTSLFERIWGIDLFDDDDEEDDDEY